MDALDERLGSTSLVSQNVEADLEALGELVYKTASEFLAPSTRKHKEWFDEASGDIKQLLDEKHRLQRHTSLAQSPQTRKIHITTYADQYSRDSARCKTHG